jgi:hypothetical protein
MSAPALMSNARGRLLPAPTPVRFFLAAAVFHLAAWGALGLAAGELADFAGGPGMVLATVHLATLGVLSCAAFGAAFQLLPVATRAPIGSAALADLAFWLLAPGVAILTGAMALQSADGMIAGAAVTAAAFALFAGLTLRNLARAPSPDAVMPFVRAALAALAGFVSLGLALALDGRLGLLADHMGVARAHMVLAAFGFFGALVAGFGAILLPMFSLASNMPPRLMRPLLAGLGAAVAAAAAGLAFGLRPAALVGGVLGLAAAALYVVAVERMLTTRLRRKLGDEFVLIRVSEAALLLAVALGGVLVAGAPVPRGEALFGWLMVAGWLLSFVLAILQRILPFLISMHVRDARGRPPLASTLAPRLPLVIHSACHLVALCGVGLGVALDVVWLVRAGALVGAGGAVAFLWFAVAVAAHVRASSTLAKGSGS